MKATPVALLASVLLFASVAGAEGVELHAHLFMKQGLGWLFDGSFDEPIQADSWDDRLSSNANAETLEASGANVVVVALFAHPLFVGDPREAVRAQIDAAERFAARSGWAIARDPKQASRLLEAGKRVLVLSLEGAGGVLESEDDLREFIDQRGIRIVAPLHLVDDRVGGPAFLGDIESIGNPLGVVDQLLDPHDRHGVAENRRGLTAFGRRLIVELVRRGVWIDLTHTSDEAVKDMLPILRAADQPPLVTHTTLRRYHKVERALSNELLDEMRRRGGIVGLMPSAAAMGNVPPARPCPSGCDCAEGVHGVATVYRELAEALGAPSVMLGADWNGGMRHLPPSCGTGTSLDDEAGLYHMGQERELWIALKRLGAPVPPLDQTVKRFLETWARVRRVPLDAPLPRLPAHSSPAGPSLALWLGAGIGSTGAREPGVAAIVDMRVRNNATDAERFVYFAAIEGDVTVALDPADVAHLSLSFAPVGIAAELDDNRALAEGLPVRIGRHLPLDHALSIQPSLLRGLLRTMPGILKDPGCFNLFLEIEGDLIGYKHITYSSDRPDLEALHFIGAGTAFGARSYFERDVFLSLEARLFIDANLALPDPALESDASLGGRAVLGFVEQGVRLFWQTSWLGTRDAREPEQARSTLRHLGGVVVSLF